MGKRLPLASTLLALLVTGCEDPQGGTLVGNGAAEVSLELSAYDAASNAAKSDTLVVSGGVRVDELWMVVDRIRLRPGTDCSGDDSELDVDGPLVADVIGQGLLGGPTSFPIAAGPFCRFEVGFHRLEAGSVPAGVPPELADLSLLMRGERGDGTPFVVRSDDDEEFRLDATDGSFTLPEGVSPLFLAYELGTWMAALNLDTLTGSPIEVDDQQNQEALQAFEEAVKDSARLFRDQDQDGALGSGETDAEDELAD